MGFRITSQPGMKERGFFNRLVACDIIYASPTINRESNMRLLKLLSPLFISCALFANSPSADDRIREHVEIIRTGDYTFNIDVGGTKDPENIEIIIENTGTVPVVNPRITVNGRYNWYTLEGLAAEITAGCRSEEEKAWAIFNFIRRESYWWPHPKDVTAFNPVRHFNVYGYHICAMAATHFTALCRAAGVQARVWEIYHHTVAEAFWDGAWHVMDPDMGMWFLKEDNRTLASMADLEEHPEWVARAYKPPRTYVVPGTGERRTYRPEARQAGDEMANWYATRENNYIADHYDKWANAAHNMNFTLRPREKLVRWWTPELHKYYDQKTTQEPPRYSNGQIVFEPDFTKLTYDGMLETRNIAFLCPGWQTAGGPCEKTAGPGPRSAVPTDHPHEKPICNSRRICRHGLL